MPGRGTRTRSRGAGGDSRQSAAGAVTSRARPYAARHRGCSGVTRALLQLPRGWSWAGLSAHRPAGLCPRRWQAKRPAPWAPGDPYDRRRNRGHRVRGWQFAVWAQCAAAPTPLGARLGALPTGTVRVRRPCVAALCSGGARLLRACPGCIRRGRGQGRTSFTSPASHRSRSETYQRENRRSDGPPARFVSSLSVLMSAMIRSDGMNDVTRPAAR